MKIVGIIGGIAPESTIDYYRLIISGVRARLRTDDYPKIMINSINMTEMLALVAGKKFEDLADLLCREIGKLAAAGADVAVLASNTPHIVFDRVRERAGIPMISIVEETCKRACESGRKKVGLFGTNFTMEGGFYQRVFAAHGIEIEIPDANAREYIHSKYMGELVNGVFLDPTRRELTRIASSMQTTSSIDALILGGTELPLILPGAEVDGLPLFNTTQIHVQGIIDFIA